MNLLGLQISVQPKSRAAVSRGSLLALGATIGAVFVTGTAYAYWAATGTGAGGVQGKSAIDATVTATSAVDTALWPGSPTAVPVKFTVNNTNPYPVSYTTFNTAAIGTVTGGPLADATHTCTSADFSLTATSGNLASAVPVTAGGSGQAGQTAAILKMNANAGDGCQGATVTVTLKVGGSQT